MSNFGRVPGKRWLPALLTAGCCLILSAAVLSRDVAAQDAAPDEAGIAYPLQILNFAGVDRLQTKADAVFLNCGRPEMSDVTQNWIDTTLRGLKGMDRTKPYGMMFYIKPGLSPGLTTVVYFPVTEAKEALQFFAGDKGAVREVAGSTDQFEVTDSGWGPDMAFKLVNNYLFMVPLSDSAELDRRFPAPERLVSKLTNRYDIAYSLLLKNIPPNTKKLFFELFKNQALAGLQQRDGEPEPAYRVRRANGESLVDLLDMIVSQGEELTVGGFSHLEDQTGFLEVELNGTKDSGLAQYFQNLAGRRSYFAPVVNEASTLTINASMQLDEKRRKPFVEAFALATVNITSALEAAGKSEQTADPAVPFFQSLQNTAEDGRFDVFVQLAGTDLADYRLIGGFRVLALGDFPKQLSDFLQFGKDTAAAVPAAGQRAALEGLKLNESTIAGLPVHQLPLPSPKQSFGLNMFGDTPNLYLYATPQALWFAIGQKTAREQLESYVATINKGPDAAAPQRASAPFLMTTHASNWVTIGVGESEGPKPDSFLGTVVDAFAPENDELRITGNPTDTGVRVRFDAKPGYVQWLGKAIAQQFDESMVRAARREERRTRREVPAATPKP